MNAASRENPSLACDLTAISADVREEHISTTPELFATAQDVQELPSGYAIRFQNEPGKFMAIAKFIENEQLCCPFFNFGLEVEPNRGQLWLRLTGGEGVKEILQTTLFDSFEDKTLLKKLNHTGDDAHLDAMVAQSPLLLLQGVLKQASPDE